MSPEASRGVGESIYVDRMGEDLKEKLESWLVEHGHALELRTARALRKSRLPVSEGFRYRDGRDDAVREGDILIRVPQENPDLEIALVVECKQTVSTWVGIRDSTPRRRSLRKLADLATAQHGSANEDDAVNGLVSALPWLTADMTSCSRVVEAFKGSNSKNSAHDAVRQAASAARGITNGMDDKLEEQYGELVVTGAVVGVIVTTARLFTYGLNRQGDTTVDEVDQYWVMTDVPDGVRPVLIMREAAVPELVANLSQQAKEGSRLGYGRLGS